MKRTGSMRSTVGPAVTSTVRPERSERFGASSASRAATICSGSDMRPTSASPQARKPVSGPTKCAPRPRRVSRFACVAGFRHMAAFIAGANSTGAALATSVVDSRSSAMPQAVLARMLAVAGATTIASAHLASATWPISYLRSCPSV